MGWIGYRIKAENKKHSSWNKDWELIAEKKIISQIKQIIKEAPDIDYVGEYLLSKLDA